MPTSPAASWADSTCMIVRAELIRPFIEPAFLIERDDRVCDAGDLAILNDALRSGRARILATDITGHDRYTHVLRYYYEDAVTDFLVQIDTSGYLVRPG